MFLLTISSLLLVIVMGIGLYLKSEPILLQHGVWDLLTESDWQPMKNKFGFFPFLAGSLWVTGLTILMALPVSLLLAVFLTEYSHSSVKRYVFPFLDVLAGFPSVIFGVWGTLTM